MYAATGFAVLAKGPVGAVLAGGAVLAFLAIRRDLRFVGKMMLVRGTLIAAAVGVPPYLLMAARDPEFVRYFLLVQNLGNFVSAESRHPEPLYFYLPVLIAGLFPWIAFLPAAVRVPTPTDGIRAGRTFLWVWFGFVVLFFSAAVSKLPTYVLPAFPAAALLVGLVWDRRLASTGTAPRRSFLVSCALVGAVSGCLAWVAWSEAPRHALYDAAAHGPYLMAFTAYLAGITLVGALFAWRRMDRALFATIATIVAGLIVFLTAVVGPVADSYRSSKAVAAWIDPRLEPGEPIWFYPRLRDSTLFYTDRRAAEFDGPEEIARHLEQPGAMCVVQTEKLPELDAYRDRYRIVFEYGNKSVVESTASTPTRP
jgi:4-amino-4-deoxy-L-arabinose transferase-like glycosyltransferase